jgi:hypothetical protein
MTRAASSRDVLGPRATTIGVITSLICIGLALLSTVTGGPLIPRVRCCSTPDPVDAGMNLKKT